jgi:hypothetical protein
MTALTARRVGTQPAPTGKTYVCQRCGITKPGRSSTYCRDCRDVAPDMCTTPTHTQKGTAA